MTITIRGKTYNARFCSVLVFEKAMFLIEAALKAREEGDFDKYADKWVDYCGTLLEGDVGELSLDKLTPEEMKQITDFFTVSLGKATQKLRDGAATSNDSSSPAPQGN